MSETMIKVAELREGDTFEAFGGVFSAVRIWGGGDLRTVHLQTWAQGQGAELKLRNATFVRLVSRVPDEDLKRVQNERTAASLASFDALVREVDEAPDAPDEPVELFGSCADPDEPEWTDEDLEINTVTNARERLEAALRERDEARANLARYTAVYGDPDAPVDVAHMFALEVPDERPLTGLALAADQMIKQTLAGVAPSVPEPPPALDLVNELRVANETNARQLDALRNALIVERELRAELERVKAERDEARAELKRYTDVYFDPSGPLEVVDVDALMAELERVKAERDELLAPICAPSVPEPPPRAGGALVTPLVLAWIGSQRVNVGEQVVDQALRLVMERDAFGRGKYGQGLALGDGRDTVEDLRQELGDALQYGYKARVEGVEGERLEEVRWLAHVLWLLLCADKVEVGP